MKNLLLTITALCLFASCNLQEKKARSAYHHYFEQTLKDPASLVIYSETLTELGTEGYMFKVDYGAKNGFGAMTRTQVQFDVAIGTLHNFIYVDGVPYYFSNSKSN